jgi:proteasome accessory factor B
MPSRLQRWLDIIAYLVGRRLPVSADELMRNVPAYAERWMSGDRKAHEAVRRSFERDKDELRAVGIPIRTVRYSTAGADTVQEAYVIDRRDFYLPYLRLVQQAGTDGSYPERFRVDEVDIAEQDAPLALEALQRIADVPGFPMAREARSAFRKLAFDLDPNAFSSRRDVLFLDRPGSAELTGRVRALSDALLARKRVTFRYHGIHRDEETTRDVAPYGVLFQHGHWYLIGHNATRSDVRVFRVGRMEDVVVNATKARTPDYDIPDDFRLDAWVGRQPWELGEPEEQPLRVQVRFAFPLSLWAERNAFGEHESRGTDGSAVRRFTVHQVNPFLRWLLSLAGEAQVLDPPQLADAFRDLAANIAQSHSETEHAG